MPTNAVPVECLHYTSRPAQSSPPLHRVVHLSPQIGTDLSTVEIYFSPDLMHRVGVNLGMVRLGSGLLRAGSVLPRLLVGVEPPPLRY